MCRKLFIFIILGASFNVFGGVNQKNTVQHQMEELMKAQQEMMNSLLDDSGFQNFDKHFEDLVKKFEQNDFSSGQGQGLDDEGDVVGEYDWRETFTHQILVLKVKQVKNKPLDIKIEKGQIKLKGDVESVDLNNPKSKSFTKVHFERSFSIPADVDQTTPEFENKAGELLIKFKKLRPSKAARPKANSVDPLKQQQPITKDQDDVTI